METNLELQLGVLQRNWVLLWLFLRLLDLGEPDLVGFLGLAPCLGGVLVRGELHRRRVSHGGAALLDNGTYRTPTGCEFRSSPRCHIVPGNVIHWLVGLREVRSLV